MEITETVYAPTRRDWRDWLQNHHATKTEIWLVYPRKASGKPRVAYEDAVEEALCFGWIDGIAKTFDGDASAQRFTPRKRKSAWSELNKARARRLIAAGQMTVAGLTALGGALEAAFVVPADIEDALRTDAETWANWERFPEDYRRVRIGYVEDVRKRPEEFQKRLASLLRNTAQNKRFGTWK